MYVVYVYEYVCSVIVYEFYRNIYLNEAGKQRELRTERDPGHIRLKAAGCPNRGIPNSMAAKGPTCKVQEIPREASKPVLRLHQDE